MIDVMSASKDELIDYARNELGMNPRAGTPIDSLREAIAKEQGIELPKKARADAPPKADSKKMVMINIHPVAGKTGRQDVFVSVNDKDYLIKRGVNVRVPPEVVEVLNHAVEDAYEYDEVAKDMVRRETLSYPFTIVPD